MCTNRVDFRPRVLTFGDGEQVAEVGAGLLRGRRLEAPDLPQYELVVGGQTRQVEEVVALLALQGGAGHAAVQHLWRGDRKGRCDYVNVSSGVFFFSVTAPGTRMANVFVRRPDGWCLCPVRRYAVSLPLCSDITQQWFTGNGWPPFAS